MTKLEYTLFRVRLVRPDQRSILHDSLTASESFARAIAERPSLQKSSGVVWHIGNIRRFGDGLGYFAVGRTTTSTVEKLDESTGDFLEEQLETSPYTHCVFNAQIGIVGIARKTNVYPTAQGFANRLKELLSSTSIARKNELEIGVAPIPDPEGFLAAIEEAHSVTVFTAHFSGPNPVDADELFQKPLSVYLSAAKGSAGRTIIKGGDLDREVVAGVARSTASSGNQASARIKDAPKAQIRTIQLQGNPVQLHYEERKHSVEQVARDLTEKYFKVRSNE